MFCRCSCIRIVFAVAGLALLASGCSGDNAGPATPPDGGEDVPLSPTTEAGATTETGTVTEAGGEASGPGVLAGTVTDIAGVVVLGAKIEAGGATALSDAQGRYSLAGVAPGTITVKVTQSWFRPLEQAVAVSASGVTPWNPVLTEMPLDVDPADRALADAYNLTFDWTRQTIAIAIAPRPTRCAFDNAVYLHNPALYRDTSSQPPVTPAPQPQIVAGAASGFTFPVVSGTNKGQEALDLTTLADTIASTPLGPTEPVEFMVWGSMVNWLGEWSAAKSVTVKLAGLAVRQQGWGSNALRPQDIEKVFIEPGTGRLWVKVVFENFVELGPGITDDDGDGRKEIYAALGSTHYTAEIVDALANTYMKTTFSTHVLGDVELSKSLNELYSTTAAKVEGRIGQPFTVPGLGTFVYPFVVLKHAGGQENVVLIAPGP
jgi:hypothetical protein